MSDGKLALVNEMADSGDLIVGYTDGSGSATVSNHTDDAEVGDIVEVEETVLDRDKAVEVVKKGGYDRGRTVGVVEAVFDDTIAVRTENGLIEISSPNGTVEEGYTIAITPSQTFSQVLSEDPIEITPKPDLEVDAINLNLGSENEDEQKEPEQRSLYQRKNIEEVSFDDIIG